jgi:vacuolar-type H+-ATPase subunit D/Vma8
MIPEKRPAIRMNALEGSGIPAASDAVKVAEFWLDVNQNELP